MSTPVKFSISNDEEPIPTAIAMDDCVKRAISYMVEKALLDRDGTLTLNVTPNRIDCEYHPTPEQPKQGR